MGIVRISLSILIMYPMRSLGRNSGRSGVGWWEFSNNSPPTYSTNGYLFWFIFFIKSMIKVFGSIWNKYICLVLLQPCMPMCDTVTLWVLALLSGFIFRYHSLEDCDIFRVVNDWCIINYNFKKMIETCWIVLFLFCWIRRYWFTRCNDSQGGKVFVRSSQQI